MKQVPFTFLTLWHQKLRTTIAVAGVTFATLLVFLQLGFYDSAKATATFFFDKLDFDLILISPDYMDINRPGSFPRHRLYQALAVPGVEGAVPLYLGGSAWRIVDLQGEQLGTKHGLHRGIMIVGFELGDPVFRLPELAEAIDQLKVSGNVLIDTKTRNYFKKRDIGVETDVGLTRVRIAGKFTVGTGYGADGMILMSDRTFARIMGDRPLDKVSLGLIKLLAGADADSVAGAIRSYFPDQEVRVLTRQAMEAQELNYWLNKTAVGQIFLIGVVVALIVGTVFVYQVISSDISNRFGEYATLKALGYTNGYIFWQVLQQALLYSLCGYLPGFLLSLVLYRLGASDSFANLPIWMTTQRAVVVLAMSLAMCAFSGFFALRKVRAADPADLF